MSPGSKVVWSLLVVLAVGLAVSGIVDQSAEDYADDAFKRALVTFAAARTLNGVVSLAQGTEVALEPGGVGINLGVGQILDPINDLVEQFSGVMLVATTSLGLQNVLVNITQWWGFTALVCAAGIAVIAALWWPGLAEHRWVSLATRALLFALVLRFIVPALIIGTNLVAIHFLASEQAAATAALEATSQQIEDLNAESEIEAVDPDASLLDRLGNTLRETMQSMDIEGRLEKLKAAASNATEHIIHLIVLFALQTVILPIAIVWLIIELLKGAVTRTAGGA